MIADKPKNIDEYILGFQPEIQILLETLRSTIKKAAPEAKEVISYNMPAYRQNGILVYFAANKNHIGFYPTSAPIQVFSEELKAYKTSKGAIQFPMDKPLPLGLITKIVEFRKLEDSEKAKKKLK